jgi:hypothetical protein
VLYAIFVSPLFDITPILSFADDSYNIVRNKNKIELMRDMEKNFRGNYEVAEEIRTKSQSRED